MKSNKLINSWVFFLVACIELLEKNGTIAFVIPAEIMQVAYAEVFWTLPIQKDYVRFRKSLEYFLTRWKKQGIIYGPTRNNQIHSTQQTNIEFGIPDEYNDPYRYITGTSDKELSFGN